MKKLLGMFLVIIIALLGLTACKNEDIANFKQKLECDKSLDIKDAKLEEIKDIREVKIDTTKPVLERNWNR